MGIGDDFAKLRGEGLSDDQILSEYRDYAREYAPHDISSIDRLLGEGAYARDILDTIADTPVAPPNPQASEGVLEKSGKALQYGAAQAAAGLGSTAKWIGQGTGLEAAKQVGAYLEDTGRAIAPRNYKPASQDFFDPYDQDKGLGGFGWGYLPRMILEGSPGLAMDIGAGALTGGAGFLASNAARTFGGSMDARTQNNGGKEASAADYAIAGGSSALQAALGRIGINPALSSVTKGAGLSALSQLPGQMAKAGAVDAASGVAGNVIDQAGVTAGTDKGLTISPHEAMGSGISSGAMGASVRGARGVGDVTNAIRFRDMDEVVGERLAGRFQRLGIDPKSPEDAHRAIEATEESLKRESSTARTQAFKRLGDRAVEAHEIIYGTESLLDNGSPIAASRFDQLRDAIGGTPQGDRLIAAFEERSALNLIKSTGRYDDDEGTFAGGLSATPFVNDTLNPLSWFKDKTKRAVSGMAGIGLMAEVPFITQAVTSGMLPKALALQAAAYSGARALDALTASRNPLAEYLNRFDDSGASASKAQAPGKAPSESIGGDEGRAARAGLYAVTNALDDSPRAGKPMPISEGTTAGADRADKAALSAVEEALRAPEASTESTVPSGGSEKAVDGHQSASGHGGSAERLTGAGEPPRASSGRSQTETISSSSGRYSVERSMDGVGSRKRYVARTREHLDTRAKLGDELEDLAPSHARAIEGLINKLNKQARSADEAYSFVEDTINALPWDKRSEAFDIFLRHEPQISATFRR